LAAAPALLAACARRVAVARRRLLYGWRAFGSRPNRVIRTSSDCGRSARPDSSFAAKSWNTKTVIHNYGHGGAGITLSWGTAQLAVEEAAKIETRECGVIGCGVVGLSTARMLQQRATP